MSALMAIAAMFMPTAPAVAQAGPQPMCGPAAQDIRVRALPRSGKLGDQPPAAEVKTVLRYDRDGCLDPLVTRHGIGGNPERALPLSRSARGMSVPERP